MTLKQAALRLESLPELPGRTFLQISYALYAE